VQTKQWIKRGLKRWVQKRVGWDNLEFDSTDWAHPAWHRGTLHGLHGAIRLVDDVISGKNDGTSGMYEDADKLRQMVLELKRERDSLHCECEQLRLEVLRQSAINKRDDCG